MYFIILLAQYAYIDRFVRVFFCKQKTAYGMRISDWSSDVCSSDLIDGPTGNRQAGAGSAAGKMNVQSSQVQGPSGSVNTGVSNQSQRTMTAGPAIERKQQNVESKVANAGAVLDDLLSQMSQTQDARIEAKTTQVSTTRAINQEMTAATQDMIQRVKPVFERQKAIADQALEIQSMSPIARAVRGFFDLT